MAPQNSNLATDLAPWRSPLARALHRNRAVPYSRFLQLATVRANGTPANRTVVFRGFLDGTNQLMMITDRRSEKMTQLVAHPTAQAAAAEVCWYFTKTREQFRISGRLTAITAANKPDDGPDGSFTARTRLWQSISDHARLQFAWPHPKALRTGHPGAFKPPAPDAQTPPETFCLLLLNPDQVDHLCLRGEPQNRTLYALDQPTPTTIGPNTVGPNTENGPDTQKVPEPTELGRADSSWMITPVNP